MMKILFSIIALGIFTTSLNAQRLRDYGIEIGIFKTGKENAITDVPGVKVGHTTLIKGDSIRTGVTAIIPHSGNVFQRKCPGAIYIGNGFGKLAGISQVEELGTIETPIVLTNTLSVATGINALITYTLNQPENKKVRSVNAVVGETNDGYLNDIQGKHVKESDVIDALNSAASGPVEEGNVGAGTGTRCFGYKGGIGTSSRKLPESLGGYSVGVLVQTNFGGILEIAGAPVGKELGRFPYKNAIESSDGSCMIVVITDAPVSDRNLKRMAKRAVLGIGKTGGIMSNGSGDYVIALSNHKDNLVPYQTDKETHTHTYVRNDDMTPLFIATIEATEEAILNSLFAAESMTDRDGNQTFALPKEEVIDILKKYGRLAD
ncbi:P1 family peptidase [Ekhidna sp.]|uniref:DmpA family aminopeptidase n=1 Tax=Ekhidna sp. TaxID=2608089 RepID=UPI003CCC3518